MLNLNRLSAAIDSWLGASLGKGFLSEWNAAFAGEWLQV
jgi:hypothetical protein